MPRSNTALLAASTTYLKSNLPLVIAAKYPFIDRVRRAGGIRRVDVQGTNVKYRVGAAAASNPWVFKSPTFSTTAGTYFNELPQFLNFVISKLEVPFAVDTDQKDRYDRANIDQKGAIVESIMKTLMSHYANKVAIAIGGANDQTGSQLGGLPFMCDTANNVGGLASAIGHAAKMDATLTISMQNLRLKKRYMEEVRAATPTCWLASTNSSGNDLEGKLANYGTQATVVRSDDKKPNYGHVEYTILGLDVVTLSTLPVNEFYLLQEDELACYLPESPDSTGKYVIPGTSVEAETLWTYNAFFPLSPRQQYRAVAAS